MAVTKTRLLKHDFPVHGNTFGTLTLKCLAAIERQKKSLERQFSPRGIEMSLETLWDMSH